MLSIKLNEARLEGVSDMGGDVLNYFVTKLKSVYVDRPNVDDLKFNTINNLDVVFLVGWFSEDGV